MDCGEGRKGEVGGLNGCLPVRFFSVAAQWIKRKTLSSKGTKYLWKEKIVASTPQSTKPLFSILGPDKKMATARKVTSGVVAHVGIIQFSPLRLPFMLVLMRVTTGRLPVLSWTILTDAKIALTAVEPFFRQLWKKVKFLQPKYLLVFLLILVASKFRVDLFQIGLDNDNEENKKKMKNETDPDLLGLFSTLIYCTLYFFIAGSPSSTVRTKTWSSTLILTRAPSCWTRFWTVRQPAGTISPSRLWKQVCI